MSGKERPDDFQARRAHLKDLSDQELHDRFWQLVDKIVAPLIEEARSHTTPSIERSVLLRMGFSSLECRELVETMQAKGLLGHGAGRQVLELSRLKRVPIREAGEALLQGHYWEELPL
jgi:D-ornithine 4,5-aminomutase subunit alpha